MTVTDFRDYREPAPSTQPLAKGNYFATVTVTRKVGWLWRRHKISESRIISRDPWLSGWYYIDTGEFCSAGSSLEQAYRARVQLARIIPLQPKA